MLGQSVIRGPYDFMVKAVAKVLGQNSFNYLKSFAVIMGVKSLNIFEEKGFRALRVENFRNIEEKCSARVFKSFPPPSLAKWLARKSRGQNIKIWNISFIDLGDVPSEVRSPENSR